MYVKWPYQTLVADKSSETPLYNEQDIKAPNAIIQLFQTLYTIELVT